MAVLLLGLGCPDAWAQLRTCDSGYPNGFSGTLAATADVVFTYEPEGDQEILERRLSSRFIDLMQDRLADQQKLKLNLVRSASGVARKQGDLGLRVSLMSRGQDSNGRGKAYLVNANATIYRLGQTQRQPGDYLLFNFVTDARTPDEGVDVLLKDAADFYYGYLVSGWTCR